MTRSQCLLGVGLALFVSSAEASPITFAYAGTIDTAIGFFDPSYIDDPAGQPFTGTYTYDSTAPDLIAAPQNGSYAGSELTLALTSRNYVFPSVSIGVTNLAGLDQYLVGYSDFGTTLLSIALNDLQGTALSSDALPALTLAQLSAFESKRLFFQVMDLDGNLLVDVNGDLTSFRCVAGCSALPADAAVPEPGTLSLLAGGLAAIAARRRARKLSA